MTANDDPPPSPTGWRLSSLHPRATAIIGDKHQSLFAPLTTSQSRLDATTGSKLVRKEGVQDRNRRFTTWSAPCSRTPPGPPRLRLPLVPPRKRKATVERYIQTGEDGYVDDVDESQTYDIEGNLLDVSRTPMADLSVRPPKRVPPLIQPLLTHVPRCHHP